MRELGPVAPTAQALRILGLPSYFPYMLLKEWIPSCSKGLFFGSTRFMINQRFMVIQNVPRVDGHRSCAHGLHQHC